MNDFHDTDVFVSDRILLRMARKELRKTNRQIRETDRSLELLNDRIGKLKVAMRKSRFLS